MGHAPPRPRPDPLIGAGMREGFGPAEFKFLTICSGIICALIGFLMMSPLMILCGVGVVGLPTVIGHYPLKTPPHVEELPEAREMREEDERIEEAKRCFVARPDMTLEMFEHRLDKIMGIAPVPELTKMTEDEIFERRAKQVADDITATFAVPPGYSVLDDLARSYKAKPLRDAKGRFIKKFQFDVHLLDEPYPIEIMTPAYAPLPATMIKE